MMFLKPTTPAVSHEKDLSGIAAQPVHSTLVLHRSTFRACLGSDAYMFPQFSEEETSYGPKMTSSTVIVICSPKAPSLAVP
jgi:hypothetical protein